MRGIHTLLGAYYQDECGFICSNCFRRIEAPILPSKTPRLPISYFLNVALIVGAVKNAARLVTLNRKSPQIAPNIFYDLDFCPIRSVFARLSSKWNLLILTHLNFGSHRFSEVLAAISDISQRMLTQSLRSLERDGMVTRKVTPSVPPRVDYTITELGRAYLAELEAALHWSLKNRATIEANQASYDEAN